MCAIRQKATPATKVLAPIMFACPQTQLDLYAVQVLIVQLEHFVMALKPANPLSLLGDPALFRHMLVLLLIFVDILGIV